MNTMKTKRDMSFEIQHAAKWLGVSYREIAIAANVGASTISRAARHGYKVNHSTHLAIARGIQSLISDRRNSIPVTDEYIPTAKLAANLEKQVEQLRDTITGSGLVDDAIESAHSREKAELQKALAARISEVEELTDDVAYWKKESYDGDELLKAEREKGLDTLNQLLRAEDLLKTERLKNETQYQSIGQCFAEIKRLQGDLKDAQSVISVQEKQIDLGLDENDRLKRLVALRTQDLAVYQKELEAADNRADDAEDRLKLEKELLNDQVNLVIKKNVEIRELENKLATNRAWMWLFVVLAVVAATLGAIK